MKMFLKSIGFNAACLLAAAAIAAAPRAPAADSPALDLARQLNQAFVEVADKVSPAVVVIDVREKPNGKDGEDGGSFWNFIPPDMRRHFHHQHEVEGEGSGVIISADGYILSNNHVVEDADEILVRLKDGRVFTGEVKGADADSDIAVIKIKATNLPVAKLGDSESARVGEFVLAIGAPFELSDTVTVGHISAKGRIFEREADQDFLQTDAKILPGNSGGPLVNLYGEVIGINTMIEGLDTGIGFAVPINLARRVKDHLINEGKYTRSWLGIEISELNLDLDYLGLGAKLAPDVREGVVVDTVLPGGPASKSELQPGDVIVSVDGKAIQTTRQLRNEIAEKKPGQAVALVVVRGKDHLNIRVTPGIMPAANDMAAKEHRPNGASEVSLGLTVQTFTRELAQRYGVQFVPGVVVTDVTQDSPADLDGIKAGDVITRINRQSIKNTREFHDAVKSGDSKHGYMVILVRDGANMFMVLKDSAATER
jgi:serine protease Do